MNKIVSSAVWDGNGALDGKDSVQKNTVYRIVCFPERRCNEASETGRRRRADREAVAANHDGT